jgi:hypothetical protein
MGAILEVHDLKKKYGELEAVRGRGVMEILPNALILIGFAVLFFVIGLHKVKFE